MIAQGSPKIVVASSKDTPCYFKFVLAIEASHSNSSFIVVNYSSKAIAARDITFNRTRWMKLLPSITDLAGYNSARC